MFRRITANADEMDTIAIDATFDYKWQKLANELGEDWIAYAYLGPKESVQHMLTSGMWDSIEDVPKRGMSTDAASDVEAP